MNKTQKFLLWLAIILIVGLGLFPPWNRTDAQGVKRYRGRSFLLNPPRSSVDALLINAPVQYSIDWVSLGGSWLCVAGVGLPVIVLTRTRRKKEEL
jgi:hypothetical protein